MIKFAYEGILDRKTEQKKVGTRKLILPVLHSGTILQSRPDVLFCSSFPSFAAGLTKHCLRAFLYVTATQLRTLSPLLHFWIQSAKLATRPRILRDPRTPGYARLVSVV